MTYSSRVFSDALVEKRVDVFEWLGVLTWVCLYACVCVENTCVSISVLASCKCVFERDRPLFLGRGNNFLYRKWLRRNSYCAL